MKSPGSGAALARSAATIAVAVAIIVAAWMVGDGDRSADPPRPQPAASAFETCPKDALPLEGDAVGKSVRTTLTDARNWVRATDRLEVAGAARAAVRDPSPGCTRAFGERAVLVWLREPRNGATWEFVVYRTGAGYRVWRGALCCGPGPDGGPPPPGPGPPPPPGGGAPPPPPPPAGR
jgi:hypothetical protein